MERRPWSVRVTAVAVLVLCAGLVLRSVSDWWDVTHFQQVTAQMVEEGNGSMSGPTAALGRLALDYVGFGVVAITLVVLAVTTIMMVRRVSAGAQWTTFSVALVYLGVCGFAAEGPRDHGTASDPGWLRMSDALALPLVIGGAVLIVVLLLLPASRRAFRRPAEVGTR